MKKVLAVTVLLGMFAISAFAGHASAEFSVQGMVCDSCKAKAEKALKATDGIHSATVDLENGVAKIEYDDQKISPEKIKKVINDSGFTAEEKKSKS